MKKTKIAMICQQCGKEYFLDRANRKNKSKYCTHKCSTDSKIGVAKVENFKNRYRVVIVNGKKQLLHRYIYEKHIGRKLNTKEHIHHVNGNRLDNRIENLMLTNVKDHNYLHKQIYPLTKECIVCDKEFTPKPTKRKRQKACSDECFKILQMVIFKNPKAPTSMYRDNACPCQKKKRIDIDPGLENKIRNRLEQLKSIDGNSK